MMSAPATRFRRWISLAALPLVVAGCAGATPIRDLLNDSSRYNGKTVRIKGKVTQAAGLLGRGAYQIRDNTGKLTVLSEHGSAPPSGSTIGVKGRFESLFTLGRATLAVLREESRSH
ncbi:MAG: hypothetical protein H0W67_00245 [Gemmatimonadales bacterium]|nr:hypothetical protein [Gemmatimonadales bacterium]